MRKYLIEKMKTLRLYFVRNSQIKVERKGELMYDTDYARY